jgi:hypothetical protein
MRIHSSGRGSCRYKKEYRRKPALGAAARLTKELGEEMHAYKCATCHCWHIGHAEPYRIREQRYIAAFKQAV